MSKNMHCYLPYEIGSGCVGHMRTLKERACVYTRNTISTNVRYPPP